MSLPRSALSKCLVYSQFRVHKISTGISDSTTAGQHGWKIKDRDRCWLWYCLLVIGFIQCSLDNSILVVLIDRIIRFGCLTWLAIHLSEKKKWFRELAISPFDRVLVARSRSRPNFVPMCPRKMWRYLTERLRSAFYFESMAMVCTSFDRVSIGRREECCHTDCLLLHCNPRCYSMRQKRSDDSSASWV